MAPAVYDESKKVAITEISINSLSQSEETLCSQLPVISDHECDYPPLRQTITPLVGIYLVTFLISVDRPIIAVAIPSITNEFNSLGHVGWYGSSYLLGMCALMLTMGRAYTMYDPKWVYLGSLAIFEIGSAVCGSASSSVALIIGRTIAGVGCAGLVPGAVILVIFILPLRDRPVAMGVAGLIFGIACSLGPVIGGALTDGPGWRWCFYLNIPCGGIVLALLVFFLYIPSTALTHRPRTFKEKLSQFDLIGTVLFSASVICILFALQWGGVTYQWANVRILTLFTLSAILLVTFVFVQIWKGDSAMVPGRVIKNRSLLAAMWYQLFSGAALQTMFYYVPIWFQAIKGVAALDAGVMNLPMVIAYALFSVIAGVLAKKTGYCNPWMIISSILTPIGAGLISTFTQQTAFPKWIGYQTLFGLGLGVSNQQPSIAVQTLLPKNDAPIGASLVQFCMMFGGAIFISVGNNVFDNELAQNLAKIAGVDIGSVVKAGATNLRTMVPQMLLPRVLGACNDALRSTFYLAVGLSSITILGALGIEWKSMNEKQPTKVIDVEIGQSERSFRVQGCNCYQSRVKRDTVV